MIKKIVLYLTLLLISLASFHPHLNSQEDSQPINDLQDKINEYTEKLVDLSKAKDTLTNQIKILDSQINLTQLKISQTENTIKLLENEINNLSVKINDLDRFLDQMTMALIQQINQNYRLSKRVPFISFLFTNNFNGFLEQHKYISLVQKNSQQTIVNMETVRTNYDIQKSQKEKKQEELLVLQNQLAEQNKTLAQQKSSKANLLAITRNDEKKYQELLSQARAELEAIEAIIAGKGYEEYIKDVKAGEKVASLIQGKSCNSSGTHLHFMVKKNGAVQNPFGFLSSISINNSSGDNYNPSGLWGWPLKPNIILTQGYGVTNAIKNNTWVRNIYTFHNGIDIYSDTSSDVLSTHDGKLFRGSYKGNCVLKYVRIENTEDKTETLYLHVNYF